MKKTKGLPKPFLFIFLLLWALYGAYAAVLPGLLTPRQTIQYKYDRLVYLIERIGDNLDQITEQPALVEMPCPEARPGCLVSHFELIYSDREKHTEALSDIKAAKDILGEWERKMQYGISVESIGEGTGAWNWGEEIGSTGSVPHRTPTPAPEPDWKILIDSMILHYPGLLGGVESGGPTASVHPFTATRTVRVETGEIVIIGATDEFFD